MKVSSSLSLLTVALLSLTASAELQKPPITLDEFMNATEIHEAHIAPDGSAAVISVTAPDWQQNRFAENLWLWNRRDGKLIPLTHSGHDSDPAFSPDGRYIAFLSDRAVVTGDDDADTVKDDDKETSRVWIITVNGGEPFPLYREKLDAHTFAWSADSASIDFAVTQPLSKDQDEAHKAEWKDVIRWREQERGDVLVSLSIASVVHASANPPLPHAEQKTAADKPSLPAGAATLAHSAVAITEIVPSPDGQQIAFETGPVSHRMENPADTELYVLSLKPGAARQLTHNLGLESQVTWSPDSKRIYFAVRAAGGSIDGAYRDVQGRIYSLDPASGAVTRLGAEFSGSWEDFTIASDGKLYGCGLLGTGQKVYRIDDAKAEAVATVPGNYAHLEASLHGAGFVFTHSEIGVPTQVYFSDGASSLGEAKAITAFNPIFAQRSAVAWTPYKWKSSDGTSVEGVLIYPVGVQPGTKNLRMLTLIHGGPADADGNHFEADWYDWATLAAAKGWLVFRPNYRGSSGYGDEFMLQISPHLVSVPGVDILSGVDALVKDGIADPNRLAIGGYSYGGYMTNWLITQTTRFKAAVTGAGAVEHAANWGNDDLTWDDAWYLSGTPWEKPELYQSEAALFQLNKVTTPTHIVGGNADDRVSYFEQVLLERALQKLNVPHALLVFPGENHPLDKNPWHGYIKVREELKWLDKYDPK